MTVYNYFDGAYKRTIVPGIMWRHIRNEVTYDGKLIKISRESITIDCSTNNGYVHRQDFDGVNGWTLNETTKKDIIVLGSVNDEISATFTIADLLKKYSGYCGIITSVIDDRNRPFLPIIKAVAE